MIKGARKEMIVVRIGNSRYFDEAYFVLREDVKKDTRKSTDILGEANRILSEISPESAPTPKIKNRKWVFFGAGGVCGAVLGVLLMLLLV